MRLSWGEPAGVGRWTSASAQASTGTARDGIVRCSLTVTDRAPRSTESLMGPKLVATVLAAVLAGAVPAAAATGYSVRTLHFDVLVGPGGVQHCDIVGDLYTPAEASP